MPMSNLAKTQLPSIILASGSPRRRELLASLGLDFQVIKPNVDEEAMPVAGMSPAQIVCLLAETKARAVAEKISGSGMDAPIVIGRDTLAPIVIGSDTIVVLEGQVFGKPKDEPDAHRMLKALQGRTHQVYTGISVIHQGRSETEALSTDVTFRPMDDALIVRYIATGEPMDKAGAYAIQGFGSLNIERINGCYFNVVGMSLILLNRLLARHGVALL